MKLALISDIHANLHALTSVLEDIGSRGLLDRTYHLGDLVGYAPFPNETVAMIGSYKIPGVAGNYDSTVAAHYDHCGCRYEDPEQERLAHESFTWTLANTRQSAKDELARLPFRMDVKPFGGHRPGPQVILVHGAPTVNTLYWHADRSDDFCRKMAATAGAGPGDVLAFGHTHLPWSRVVNEITFVNTGSVGRPKDGDWRAGYVILDVDDTSARVEFVRVEYDLDAATRAIRNSTLPAAFADFLEAGGRPGSGGVDA